MAVFLELDHPASEISQDPLNFRIEGRIRGDVAHVMAIEIEADDRILGRTELFFRRPISPETDKSEFAFSLLSNASWLVGQRKTILACQICFSDGRRVLAGKREVGLIAHDYRQNHYGALLRSEEIRLYHRKDIYGSGQSVHAVNSDCLTLIRRHLPPPKRRIVDVGCGFGGYGRVLLAAGYDWLGVEVKASDCAELARQGLPYRQVDGRELPFESGEFDCAICIEVLEHIAEPEFFLSEIRRVIQGRLLLSVPNMELIPYLQSFNTVPWNLLEADHKNFFTRASLLHLLSQFFRRAEVIDYSPHPLRTPEGLPLYNHLFAICDR